jgi:hypothetical protein
MSKSKVKKSIYLIAKLLGTSGFDSHAASCIKKYFKSRHMNKRQYNRYLKAKKAFSTMCHEKLNDADRIVLGKMMGLFQKMMFDTGLRIGLTAQLFSETDLPELGFEEVDKPTKKQKSCPKPGIYGLTGLEKREWDGVGTPPCDICDHSSETSIRVLNGSVMVWSHRCEKHKRPEDLVRCDPVDKEPKTLQYGPPCETCGEPSIQSKSVVSLQRRYIAHRCYDHQLPKSKETVLSQEQ